MKKQVKVKVAGVGSEEILETPANTVKPEPEAMAAFGQDNSESVPPDIIIEN